MASRYQSYVIVIPLVINAKGAAADKTIQNATKNTCPESCFINDLIEKCQALLQVLTLKYLQITYTLKPEFQNQMVIIGV